MNRGFDYRGVERALRLAERLCPEKIRGETEVLRKKLSVRYTGSRLEKEIAGCQRRNVVIYGIILSGVFLLSILALLHSVVSAEPIGSISRPQEGAGQKTVPVTVEARQGETSVEGTVNLIVREEERSDEENDRILEAFAEELPDLVAPEVDGQRVVDESFSLPKEDERYGISVLWESSDPVLIDSDGRCDVLALAEEQEEVELTATLTLGGRDRQVTFGVLLKKLPSLYRASISKRIEEMAEELSSENSGSEIVLPDRLGEDISLSWKRYETGGAGVVLGAGLILAATVFSRRYASADRKIRRYRSEIVRHFPPFIDKFVLLLNGGLTVFSAMEKISSDYARQFERDEKNLLAYEVSEIGRRVKETNASITKEWRELSARTGINELMRFSTIIEDNLHKGTVLAEKLEVEGNLLREKERKSVQEKMRMIDTKLTLPMILMLFSLVLVTVAPAMMQMS